MEQNPTKKCSKCQKEVDAKASKCPYCQSKISTWSDRKKIVVALLIPVFIALVVGMTGDPTSTTTPVQQISEVKYQSARILAKSYITKIPLKSPSTAKYNPPTTKVDTTNPNLFEVSSYIDSQNGFGAMIRTYWSMKLEYIGGVDSQDSVEKDANWKIVELIWDGEKIK